MTIPVNVYPNIEFPAFSYLITPVSPPFRHKPQLLSVEGRIREADDGTQRGAIPARAEFRGVQ